MLFKQKQANGTFTFFESDLNFDVDVATRATKDEEINYNLDKAKAQKINELNEFHASPEVKQLTIKAGTLEAHIGLDSDSRYLIDEQINLLKFRTDLKEVNPTWTYQNGVSVPLNLSQLIGLRLYIGSLTDYNYKARRDAEKTINALKTFDEIKNFDFKKNYKINQIIPLAI